MPRNPSFPFHCYLLGPLPNICRSVKQKEHSRRIRSGPHSVHRGKSARTVASSPMFDLRMVSALPASVMVIDDQAHSKSREFTYFTDQDAFASLGGPWL